MSQTTRAGSPIFTVSADSVVARLNADRTPENQLIIRREQTNRRIANLITTLSLNEQSLSPRNYPENDSEFQKRH